MNELRTGGIQPVEFEAFQQRELLQHHRALTPDPGLADGVAPIVIGERRFDRRLPARHVIGAQYTAMWRSADVQDVLSAAKLVDRLGDEPLRPRPARALDLRDAVDAGAFR